MTNKTPLQQVKDRFGSKEKLVSEIKAMFEKGDLFDDRLNPDKGLLRVANAKLLKLYEVGTEVKEKFSSREKLTQEILKILEKQKDDGLKARFDKWGLPRLFDYYKAIIKKAKTTTAKAAKA